jgi:hypothetical protein
MDSDKQISQSGKRAQWGAAAVFILVGLVLAFFLQEALLFGLRHYGEGNVGVMNRIARGEVKADVVISGSSRAAYHYDPSVIQAGTGLKTFNIGRDGTRLHEQLDLLRVYLAKNPHPRYLLQNLDVMGLQENDDVTDAKQYIAWLQDEQIFRPLKQRKRYYLAYRWCPLLGICREGGMEDAVLGLFQAADKNDTFTGYCPQNLTWNRDFDKFKAKRSSGWNEKIDPNKLESLTKLVEICKSNRINVILVYSPDYVGTREFFQNRSEVIKTYQDVAAKLNVPFWDFSDDPVSGDQACFYNSQHMNSKGAAIFSKDLAQRLAVDISRAQQVNAAGSKIEGHAQAGN